MLAVEIAAPGSAADDPQQHQHWDWHEALILQQQLNSEDYPNATSESLELGKQCAQPSIGTSGNSGSIGNQNDACKEDREPPTVRWSLHVSLNCCCCSRFRLLLCVRRILSNGFVPHPAAILLLQRCVYHHRYWNRVTFWEEALALTVSEELQRQKVSAHALVQDPSATTPPTNMPACTYRSTHKRTGSRTKVRLLWLLQIGLYIYVRACK